MEQGKRKIRVGVVTSDRMNKTITVQGERLVMHPRFGKFLRKKTVYKVHDEKNEAKIGDKVEITETRPLSKTKRWRLIKVIKKGRKELPIVPSSPELGSKKSG